MITVALRGGIGNQMFEYAVGRHLAIKNKTSLVLDLTDLKTDLNENTPRTYELHKFRISAHVMKDNIPTRFRYYLIRWLGHKRHILRIILPNMKYFWQGDMFFNGKIPDSRGNIYLDGYWQCENYFRDIRNVLLKDFRLKNEPDKDNKKILNKIKRSNSICLHVRRSDYVTNKRTNAYHGTCTLEYYRESIKYITKRVKNPIFFIFSDDHEWTKKNIKIRHPVNFIDINNIENGQEDLRLMSHCKHFIIANSSFSWWGAWLSINKSKIVCAPVSWFREVDDGDIIPKSWIKIGKSEPKVSVLMSVYNGEKHLKKSIESILEQTFSDFDFIIVNDGSTDNSLKIIRNYMRKDKRIVLINNKKNIGLTPSLNKGLKKTRGKYIARMDADDISLKERLQNQYTYLEKNKDIFLLGSSAINIDEKGKTISYYDAITEEKKIRSKLPKKTCFYHPTIMFRNNHGFFYRPKMLYCEDYDLYLRLLIRGYKMTNLRKPLIKYRISSNSITRGNNVFKQILFIEKAQKFYFQRLKYGKDKYTSFNTKDILNIDWDKSNSKMILKYKIGRTFKASAFVETRKICKRYFQHYGFLNLVFFYYVGTFFNKHMVNAARRILFD